MPRGYRFLLRERAKRGNIFLRLSNAVGRRAIVLILCGFSDIACIFSESILVVKSFLSLKSCGWDVGRVLLREVWRLVLKLLPNHKAEGLDVTLDGLQFLFECIG
jgi:nitrogen fixation protein